MGSAEQRVASLDGAALDRGRPLVPEGQAVVEEQEARVRARGPPLLEDAEGLREHELRQERPRGLVRVRRDEVLQSSETLEVPALPCVVYIPDWLTEEEEASFALVDEVVGEVPELEVQGVHLGEAAVEQIDGQC